MRIKITEDLFDIATRIKRLDARYEIFYDTTRHKYLLTADGKIQLVVPYDNLDCRTIDYAYHTRTDNVEELEKEAEKFNADMQRKSVKDTQDRIENEFSRELRLRGL